MCACLYVKNAIVFQEICRNGNGLFINSKMDPQLLTMHDRVDVNQSFIRNAHELMIQTVIIFIGVVTIEFIEIVLLKAIFM